MQALLQVGVFHMLILIHRLSTDQHNLKILISIAILADIDTNINKDLLESIDIDIDVNIDEDLLTNINIDKISLPIWDIKPLQG